jgi:Flp pilus assembly protein TadD
MRLTRRDIVAVLFALLAAVPAGRAADLRITIPRHSSFTPVQRLNRDGVVAVQKHQYDKAEALFYKAYLFDPSDPFTLNNLGYISELRGQLDRAQAYYKLAAEQGCGAIIARSDEKDLQGKPMTVALDTLQNQPMHVNRLNIEAIALLSEGRAFEAQSVLEQALKIEPQDPFTLNNLGVASESLGDYEDALKDYDSAAAVGSSSPIVVTLNPSWRGKPVSSVAEHSARDLRDRMRHTDLSQARAAMLELRGVSEVNQNDWEAAKQDFLDAYKLDPSSAFTLNNLGYVAEKEGDIETAQFFYARARKAGDAGARIGLATQSWAQGQHLSVVAANSTHNVDGELHVYSEDRRGAAGPVQLIPRYGSDAPASQSPQH